GDLPHAGAPHPLQSDLLTFGTRQIPASWVGCFGYHHPTTLTKPHPPQRRRHSHHGSTSLDRQPQADLAPKAILHLTRHPLPQLTSTHLQHLHQLQVLQPPPEPKRDSAAQVSVRMCGDRASQRSHVWGPQNPAFACVGGAEPSVRGPSGGPGRPPTPGSVIHRVADDR